MNSITVTEVAALVGLIAVIIMATVMVVWILQSRTFSNTQTLHTVVVESGAMPVREAHHE